ncbi:MAG: hypothetical protein EA357_05805 [Micavibrio sp.]|nr:MAG: hypothetical protein EA357_05805 [Micavibrio sp.]
MPKDTNTPKDTMTPQQIFAAESGGAVMLPHEAFLHDAVLTREGADLVLTLESGETVVIEGYFATLDAPDLVSPKGGVLSPELVESFLMPTHAGEYAQSAGTMNDVSAAGQMVQVKGEVYITRADGTKIQAEAGTRVFRGDIIETVGDGAAKIVFADNSSFAISKEARLSIDDYIYDSQSGGGSSFFSMLKGAFLYTSGLIGKKNPDEVNIETPVGSIGIRGTVVAGEIKPAGEESEIIIVDGAVVFTNSTGSYDLDDAYETLRLTGYDSEPQFTTVDASYIESNYDFYTAPDSANDSDDGTTQPQDGQDGGDGTRGQEDEQQQDGAVQDGSDSDTASADADSMLVNQMVNLQMQQGFEEALGDEYIDENGGEVVTDSTAAAGDAGGGTTGGILDQTDDGTAPTGTFDPGQTGPITIDSAQWAAGGDMLATAGTLREFANETKLVGTINATAESGGAVVYEITDGDAGGVFSINGGVLTVANQAAMCNINSYTLTIRMEDAGSGLFIEETVEITVDPFYSATDQTLLLTVGGTLSEGQVLSGDWQVFLGAGGDEIFEVLGLSAPQDLKFFGGGGSDLFMIDSLNFTLIDGGYTGDGGLNSLVNTLTPGTTDFTGDTVQFQGGNFANVDLTGASADTAKFKGIENFLFSGGNPQGITLDEAGIRQMTDPDSNELRIWGRDNEVPTYSVTLSAEFNLVEDTSVEVVEGEWHGVAIYEVNGVSVSIYYANNAEGINGSSVNVIGV